MGQEMGKRVTITVNNENLEKYRKIKSALLMKNGTPELSFTRFSNVCMHLSDPTIEDIIEFSRRKKKRK